MLVSINLVGGRLYGGEVAVGLVRTILANYVCCSTQILAASESYNIGVMMRYLVKDRFGV